MRKKGTSQEWERLRHVAANMIDRNLKPAEIAPLLGVDAQTVRTWQRAYRKGGRSALASRKPPGRPTRLTPGQKRQLAELLLKTPVECGLDKYLWTQQLIAELIQREFGVSYHHDHVGVILRELGFTHQKPARRARERDGGADRGLAARTLVGPFKKSVSSGGMILMADEVGFMMSPSVKKTWAPKARTPVIPYRNRRQKKVSVLGALALHAASGRIDLLCDFHPDSYVRGEQAAAFLHRVLAEYPAGPIDLVWDNLQGHKSPIVREVVTEHPRLTLHYLPPYAPDLNAVEGVWCLTKHHRMANHTIDTLDILHAEAQRHLQDVGKDQRLLRSCFEGAGLALSIHSAQ